MNTKICSVCEKEKTLDNFYSTDTYKKYKFQVDHYCKNCRNAKNLKAQRGPANKPCTVDNCERRHYAKGYCRLHYDRVRNYGRTEIYQEVLGLNEVRHGFYSFESRVERMGITLKEWEQLSKDGCNICSAKPGKGTIRNLHVEHDHKCCPGSKSCGKCVRGVVCNRCNTAIGLYEKNKLRDDYPNREKIIDFLANYNARRKRLDNIEIWHDIIVDPENKRKEW